MAKHAEIGGPVAVPTINIVPGYSLTLLQGLNGAVAITNGHGITINVQAHIDPCTITSFEDHFGIQLGGEHAVDMAV